jgi:hypothetical protein
MLSRGRDRTWLVVDIEMITDRIWTRAISFMVTHVISGSELATNATHFAVCGMSSGDLITACNNCIDPYG